MAGSGAPASLPHLGLILHDPADYSLAADQGTYTLSGTAAALVASRTLPAAQGTYSLQGTSADLLAGYALPSAQGSYTVSGSTADLLLSTIGASGDPAPFPHLGLLLPPLGYTLPADQGSYTVQGSTASLVVVTPGAGSDPAPLPHLGLLLAAGSVADPSMDAAAGTYSVTGQSADLYRHTVLVAGTGTYDLVGKAGSLTAGIGRAGHHAPLPHIGLLLQPTATDFVMTADPGLYAIVGSDGLSDFEASAASGSYAVTGQDAGLLRTVIMAADGGSYAVAGQDAAFAISGTDRVMLADYGVYALTGQAASLLVHYPLSAEQGFYALQGTSIELVYAPPAAFSMAAESGLYLTDGFEATLQRVLIAETGTYAVTGFDALQPDIAPVISPTGGGSGRSVGPRRSTRAREDDEIAMRNEELFDMLAVMVASGALD